MSSYFDRVTGAAAWLRTRLGHVPDVAVVLGSGLSSFSDSIRSGTVMSYAQIPDWPVSRVVGHPGFATAGVVAGRKVLALAGRVHVYEGHDPATVAFAVRTLGLLGVPRVILTNAAGGINPQFAKGALMVIDDHINLTGANPLVGPNDERFGRRFPDMTEVYSRSMRRIADETAQAMGLALEHGTYLAVMGPSYETPAEIRAFRTLGADAVGMSTVPEAIAARHMGMEVLGISCISNMAAGLSSTPVTEDEVLETTSRVRAEFVAFVEGIIGRL